MQKAGGEATEGRATSDAPVDDPSRPPGESPRARRWDAIALVVTSISVVVVSLYRVITLGFVSVAPDDANYIGIGRALWSLREPLGSDGGIYTLRSWVYPLMVGGASRLSSDPFRGPRWMGWTLATVALVLALVFAFRVARGAGAVATGLTILAAPVLWTTVPSTRIEVALIFSMMLVLLVMDTPTPRRMLIGGILAGLTLLIKETSAPLVILPLAYLGTMPRDVWRRLALRFWIGFFVTIAWWFVTVLVVAGEIFPLHGIRLATGRNLPRGFTLNLSAQLLIALCIVAWLVVAIGRRRDPRGRILVLAGLAFVPASVIAWKADFAIRQFVPIALLSCIAVGVAAADVLAAALRRSARGTAHVVVAVGIVIVLVAVVPIGFTQDRTEVQASKDDLDAQVAAFIAAQPGEPVVLTTFRYKAEIWARLEGEATIRPLAFTNPVRRPDLHEAVWVDATSRDYRTLQRDSFARRLKGTNLLVLSGPHRFGPKALATWLEAHGAGVGLVPVAQFTSAPGDDYAWSSVYLVNHPRVGAIPTIVTSDAVKQLTADGGFRPTPPMVVAATRNYLKHYTRQHPTNGTDPYEPMRSAPR